MIGDLFVFFAMIREDMRRSSRREEDEVDKFLVVTLSLMTSAAIALAYSAWLIATHLGVIAEKLS